MAWAQESRLHPSSEAVSQLTSSAATQAYIGGLSSAHSNIYPICDLLEDVDLLVLWNDTHGISMTPEAWDI